LTPQTRGLIAMPEFQAMKRKPLIINTARCGLVDEADVVQTLDVGLISGAGFDVASEEPPSIDSPLSRLRSAQRDSHSACRVGLRRSAAGVGRPVDGAF